MKKTKLFLFLTQAILFFSIISCNNPFAVNTQSRKTDFSSAATGTVSGKLTFKGAIPQELIGRNTNSTSSKTAVPVFNMTNCVYVITAYDPMNDELYRDISATFNDNHTEYTLKGIPLDSPCTVEVNVYRDASQADKILTGKNTFTLTQESPIVSADVILEPIQTTSIPNTITRSVNLAIQVENDSGVGYVQVEPFGFVCTSNDNLNYILKLDGGLSLEKSEPKTVNVSFWSGTNAENKGILLYKFTETINIFDNLETNTWIKNADGTNSDPHLVLQDSQTMIADCIITQHLINNFTLTTFYVDTTAGSSTETGTSDNPFKTLQNAVDHIIENGNTTDKYTIYIKNDIDLESRILFIQTGQEIRNITIAGYDDVKTIKRTSDCSLTLFEFSKESHNITLRDLILDGQNTKTTSSNGGAIRNASNLTLENVTIQKFICTNTNSSGGAIFNGGTLTLKKSKILNCTSISDSGSAYGGAIYNGDSKTLILDDVVISGCKTQADAANNESYGGAIYNNGTCKIYKAIITGCSTIANSDSPIYAKGGAIYNKGSLTLGDSICNSDGSPDVTIGIGNYNRTEYSNPNEAFAGAGVYSGENGSTASFTMNRDCVIGKFNPTTAQIEESYGNRSIANSMSGSGGAGVWIYKTNLTINGGFISYNYAENTYNNGITNSIIGVGLYYKGSVLSQPEINNLVISYNKASTRSSTGPVAGVGLCTDESITLNNVKIENNTYETTSGTASIKGKGLYATDYVTVTLKGTTYFGTDDDIYLDVDQTQVYNGTLKVDSILNPQNTFGVPQQYVATITPGAYTTENAFLTGSKVGTEYKKFKVKTDSSGDNWGIGSNGKNIKIIGTKAPGNYAVGDIVFKDGSATPYSEGLTLTEEQKNAAIAVIFRVGDGSEGNKTLGVGIKYSNNKKMWCISNSKGYTTMFNTDCPQDEGTSAGSLTFKNSPHTDGSKNLKIMIQDLGEQNDTGVTCNEDGTINFSASPNQTTLNNNYPAFEFAYYYGKTNGHNITSGSAFENGWYLPSISELNDIYQANKNQVIQDAFEVTGNSMITDLTWSSSQGTHNTLGITNNARVFHFSDGSVSGETKHYYYYYVYAIRAFD